MFDLQSFHIHIKGRVQGVGFRPLVYKLAKAENLKGWVCNATNGLHIRLSSTRKKADMFYHACLEKKPQLAVITDSSIFEIDEEHFTGFEIRDSHSELLELNIAPDFGMCSKCQAELEDENNRRYNYPFITCTQCGPRYSITKGLPYDRPLTSMDTFEMCLACQAEYHDPMNRRYFSQTNSCSTCGIQLSLSDAEGLISKGIDSAEMLSLVIQKLKENYIIALKGIGGFL